MLVKDRGGTGKIETQRNVSVPYGVGRVARGRRLSFRSLGPALKGITPIGVRSPAGKVQALDLGIG